MKTGEIVHDSKISYRQQGRKSLTPVNSILTRLEEASAVFMLHLLCCGSKASHRAVQPLATHDNNVPIFSSYVLFILQMTMPEAAISHRSFWISSPQVSKVMQLFPI
jgi:hypothetical protein